MHSFDVVVQLTGQQVDQNHCRQEVNGVAWLAIDLLCTARHLPLGRQLVWVVLLFDDHTEPLKERCREVKDVKQK